MLDKVLSRRGVLRAALLGGVGLVANACGTGGSTGTPPIIGPATSTPTPVTGNPASRREASPTVGTKRPASSPAAKITSLAGPKHKVESLGSIPAGAEIIVSSQVHSQKGLDGVPAFELYVMMAGGDNLVQITHNGYTHNHFAVAPNRKLIACNRYAGDTTRDGKLMADDRKVLWVLDLENKEEWMLAPELEAGWGGVDWSPDGEFIYCSMSNDDLVIDQAGRTDISQLQPGRVNNAPKDLYRIRPDGTGLQKLTEGLEQQLGADQPGKWVSDLGTSHDGQWLVFLCVLGNVRKTRIAVCRGDGSQARFITDGGPLPPGMRGPWSVGDFDPEFSPDGQYICCQRVTDIGYNFGISTGDIIRVKVDGTDVRTVSPAGHTSTHGIPDWGADNRIVCTEWSQKDTWYGPAIMNADGSGYHRVEKAKFCSHARWIPNGQER